MASRTYIQMYAKLNRMGKLPLRSDLRNKILYASDWLDENPEAVEKIVQYRISGIRFLNKLFFDLNMKRKYIGRMYSETQKIVEQIEIGRWNILALEYCKYSALWEEKMQEFKED